MEAMRLSGKHVSKSRIIQFDALKGLAILLVVAGHLIDLNIGTQGHPGLKILVMLIRLVHMPIFIFVAGLFDSSEKKNIASRSMSFLFLYILAKIIYMISNRIILGTGPYFSLLSENNRPWFMLAMAAWVPLAHATRNVKLIPLLSVWIVLALSVGYDSHVGALLSLSRIIVFFPFYLLGYRIKPNTLIKRCSSRTMVYTAIVILVVILIFFTLFEKILWNYERLLNANLPYSEMPVEGCGAFERAVWYGLVILALIAFISIFTHIRSNLLAWFGKRSLTIYLFHLPFTLVLSALGLFNMLNSTIIGRAIAVFLAIPVAVISGIAPLQSFVTVYQKIFSGTAGDNTRVLI